jgi:hypothetical protein
MSLSKKPSQVRKRHWRKEFPIKSLLRSADRRAKSRGIPFNLTESDIVLPDTCPVLGLPLFYGSRQLKDNSPTIDEIVVGKGYVPGNILIVSWRANRLKSDASLEEIQRIATFYKVYGGSSMKDQWLFYCDQLSKKPASLYSGCRKILRDIHLSFNLDDSLQLSDAGYTSNKLRMLEKHYLHEESRAIAVKLWEKRCAQEKYGSVGFTTFAHFVKGGSIDAKRSKRASVFGPCIQSITLTWVNYEKVSIDVFYRTSELFKKFPADLVLIRDILLKPFDFSHAKEIELNVYFANLTIHPMYACVTFPHLKNPVKRLESLRQADNYFWKWTNKWSARYIVPKYEHGIQKFSQALRVQQDVLTRLTPSTRKQLQRYLTDNHPGYTHTRFEEEDD